MTVLFWSDQTISIHRVDGLQHGQEFKQLHVLGPTHSLGIVRGGRLDPSHFFLLYLKTKDLFSSHKKNNLKPIYRPTILIDLKPIYGSAILINLKPIYGRVTIIAYKILYLHE